MVSDTDITLDELESPARELLEVGALAGPVTSDGEDHTKGLAFLIRCAGSEADNVRRLAASALGKAAASVAARARDTGAQMARAREILTFLLKDTAPQVRQYAEKALERLPPVPERLS